MGGSIWRLLAAASMALAATAASAVDVNSATAQQLESVSGIGPSTARTIVQERERAGAFESLDDLAERVRGIGPKAKALQAAGLTVGGADGAAQNAAQGAATPAGRAARRLARPSPPRADPPRRPGSKPCRPSRGVKGGGRAPGAGAALRPTRARGVMIGSMTTNYPTIEQTVGNTPLVRLQRIPGAAGAARNVILAKLEGNNPAGSVRTGRRCP